MRVGADGHGAPALLPEPGDDRRRREALGGGGAPAARVDLQAGAALDERVEDGLVQLRGVGEIVRGDVWREERAPAATAPKYGATISASDRPATQPATLAGAYGESR